MFAFPLLIALAAGPAAQAGSPPAPADLDIARALAACKQLPIGKQRACVEPYLDDVPPQVAEMLRYETDPVLQAAAADWQRRIEAALRARAEALAEQGGARNLLAAVLLMPIQPPAQPMALPTPAPEVSAWFAAARAAGPEEPLVAWLEAGDCQWITADCDRAAAIERLLVLDPGNAAVHLMALGEASRVADEAAIARHLHHAATAERFEPVMPDLLALVFEAQEGIAWPARDPALDEAIAALWGMSSPATAEEAASVMAFGRILAIAMPGLMPMAKACPAGDLEDDSKRRADCIALHALLAADSSALYRQFALTQLSMLTAGDAAGDHWREQLRNAYWVQDRASALMPGLPGSGITGGEYARLFLEKGEAGAMQELLRRNGVPVETPADWLPAHPRQRSLVTTGTPPDD